MRHRRENRAFYYFLKLLTYGHNFLFFTVNNTPSLISYSALSLPTEAVNRSIRLFVKSAPANFYDCVDALPFLATPQNVKHDLSQLVHMLAWTPASPLEALTYFSKEYLEVWGYPDSALLQVLQSKSLLD